MAHDTFRIDGLDQPTLPVAPKRGIGCLGGCLIALGIMGVIALAVGLYVWLNWRSWASSIALLGAEAVIEDSELPDDAKQAFLDRIKGLAEEFKTGKLSVEDLAKITAALSEASVFQLGLLQHLETRHLMPADWPAEEKEKALRTWHRLIRGVAEGKIDAEKFFDENEHLSEPHPQHKEQTRLKSKLTDEEVRKAIVSAAGKVEKAEIPDEDYTLNLVEEFDKALLKARQQAGK